MVMKVMINTPLLTPLRRILRRRVGFQTIRQTTRAITRVGVMVTEGRWGVTVHPDTGGIISAHHQTVRRTLLARLTARRHQVDLHRLAPLRPHRRPQMGTTMAD